VVGDPVEDGGEPGLWVDVVELWRADQGIDGGSALTAAIYNTLPTGAILVVLITHARPGPGGFPTRSQEFARSMSQPSLSLN
jgi:hypothetical protein